VGAMGTGKTCALDCLGATCGMIGEDRIGEARFAHARQDERDRGCTLKSNVTSMVVGEMLLNVADTPGHAEYSAEFSAMLPICDGALVVVDGSGGGMAASTYGQMKEVINWGIQPVVFCNRFDVSIFVTQKSAEEIANDLTEVVDQVNMCLAGLTSPVGATPTAAPPAGAVLFGSLAQGWAFTIPQLAAMYAAKTGTPIEKMSERLWGEHYYVPKTKKWSSASQEGAVRGLIQFVINPILQVSKACDSGDMAKLEKMMGSLGVTMAPADKELEGKALFRRVMQLWMPAGPAIARVCKEVVPDPQAAQTKRFPVITAGPADDPCTLAIKACSASGPMLFQGVKLAQQPATPGRFYLVGRVVSGTMSSDKCLLLEDDHVPAHAAAGMAAAAAADGEEEAVEEEAAAAPEAAGEAEAPGSPAPEGASPVPQHVKGMTPKSAGPKIVQEKRIQGVLVCASKAFNAIPNVPAGNICAVNGIDQFVKKWVTLGSSASQFPMVPPKFMVSPVVRQSVQPKDVKDLPKMVEGLRRLSKSCPLVEVALEDSGNHVVAGCGEEHMRILKRDLEQDFLAGVGLQWSPPTVSYRETATTESSLVCLAKSPNKHNRLYVKAEPLAEEVNLAIEANELSMLQDMKVRGKVLEKKFGWDKVDTMKVWGFGPAPEELGAAYGANILVDQTKGVQYLNEIKESVNAGLLWATKQGPICEEQMRGVRFNLLDVKLHADSIHRGMGQIQPPARRVFFSSVMTGACRLVEPVFKALIEAPGEAQAGVMQALGGCRGELVLAEDLPGGRLSVQAFVPVAETIGATPFATVLSQKTNGRAFVNYRFDHWETVPSDPLSVDKNKKPLTKAAEIMLNIRTQKGLKVEPPLLVDYLDKL